MTWRSFLNGYPRRPFNLDELCSLFVYFLAMDLAGMELMACVSHTAQYIGVVLSWARFAPHVLISWAMVGDMVRSYHYRRRMAEVAKLMARARSHPDPVASLTLAETALEDAKFAYRERFGEDPP